jgi:cobalamin biosynthesis Co2+ chelatase CbiK
LAVECYKTAIIQGAEIENVEEHLDQLLQKFSLLNISKETQSYRNNDRMKILEDARNIFKSSVIQFAVQERTLRRYIVVLNHEG